LKDDEIDDAQMQTARKSIALHTHTHTRIHTWQNNEALFLIVNEPRESGQVPKEKIFLRVFSYFIYENY